MPASNERSDTVPVEHATDSDVLIFYYERARIERGLSYRQFARALAQEYAENVPADAQTIDMKWPLSPMAKKSEQQLDALEKRLKQQCYGHARIPLDLARSWIAALTNALPDEDYGDRCRRALVQRHGCLGAAVPKPNGAAGDLAAICTHTGLVVQDMGAMLADNILDEQDAPRAAAAQAHLADLQATIATAQAQIAAATGVGLADGDGLTRPAAGVVPIDRKRGSA